MATTQYKSRDEVVSSVRVEENPHHAKLTIFNRHGNSGTIVIEASDLDVMLKRLMPYGYEVM